LEACKKLIEKGHEVVVIIRGSWRRLEREFVEDIEVIKVPFIPIYPFYLKLHGKFVNKAYHILIYIKNIYDLKSILCFKCI